MNKSGNYEENEIKNIFYQGDIWGISVYINTNIDGKEMTNFWYDEKNKYSFDKNAENDYKQCKHFTQIIWRDTTDVGFGYTKLENGKFLAIALYYPCGNIVGKYEENVLNDKN